jgi:hypothetical protein
MDLYSCGRDGLRIYVILKQVDVFRLQNYMIKFKIEAIKSKKRELSKAERRACPRP